MLSGISDAEARELLIGELDKQAKARASQLATQDQRSFVEVVESWGAALGGTILGSVLSIPKYPVAIGEAMMTFAERRGDQPLWMFFAGVLTAIAAGLALSYIVQILTRGWYRALWDATPVGLGSRINILLGRFGLTGVYLMCFVVGGFMVNRLLNQGTLPDFMTGKFIIQAIGITWFAGMCAGFVLPSRTASLRLCALDDESARFLTRRIMIIFGWSAFGVGLLIWLQVFGLPEELRTGFWVGLIYYGLMALTLWQAPDAITRMVRGEGHVEAGWERFARAWPKIAVGLGHRQLPAGDAAGVHGRSH